MTLTITQARDEILTLVKTAWDATGYEMIYDDVAGEIPSTSSPWARSTLKHVNGAQATLADGSGKKRFRREGFLTVQIFSPVGDGLSSSDNSAKIIMDAFEGKATPGGVWFTNVRLNEVGSDGAFYQVNVTIDFEYDEVK